VTEKIRKPQRPATHPVWCPSWGRCTLPHNKRRFPSLGKARRARRAMPDRGDIYRCPTCGDYHVTRTPQRGVEAAIRMLEGSLRHDIELANPKKRRSQK
jgi:hypothetical protein